MTALSGSGNWAHDRGLHTLSICHGPAAFLAANLLAAKSDQSSDGFVYDDYKMAVFPDSVDKQTQRIGYLPGHMPWRVGERLTDLGVAIVNTKADDTHGTTVQ